MMYSARIVHHAKKLRQGPNILRGRAIYVRSFADDAGTSVVKIDDVSRHRPLGVGSIDKSGSPNFSSIGSFSPNHVSVNRIMMSSVKMSNGNAFWTARSHAPAVGMQYNSQSKRGVRQFSADSGLPPHQEIGMPSLSPTMTEGNIARWLKKEGDKVSPGEVLCEVETDKATVEMECMEEGYLAKILRGDGSSGIQVGEAIAVTVEEEGDIAKFKDYSPKSDATPAPPPKAPSAPTPPKEASQVSAAPADPKVSKPSVPSSSGDRIFASPLARKLAEDHHVPLANIKGTGPEGRIVKADIEDYLASPRSKEASHGPKVDTTTVAGLDYTDIPHSQIRKVTASRLLQSKQTIPHYYLTVDTCVDKLMELRSQLNSLQEASGGKRISVNDLVIKAAALALRKVPQCNSSWTNDYIRQFNNVNINVAVQTDNGLYVPVIRDADKKGLSRISDEVKHVAQKAKENSLKPEDYEGGTFTVSNLGGPFGIKQFCAIINPPQAGILAVGSAEKRVVPGAGPDQYKFASFMSVTLSCDHRVIDGAIGAEWLKAFKGYIENPESMLL
ncbi:Dihydrolipoamide acetyltransferase [Perilla frutescens var. hirtella]|nr:Dihydrolipoamide acetyltransferase [Perilla frutescens var. frutescens]KAH6793236.1 Dihydrolipoamide acetyltransferase [Perilla frutescens var. hirtella]